VSSHFYTIILYTPHRSHFHNTHDSVCVLYVFIKVRIFVAAGKELRSTLGLAKYVIKLLCHKTCGTF